MPTRRSNLKVAVITDYFPTSQAPWAGHSAYQTLRELAKSCDVHVFCSVPIYPNWLKPKTAPAELNLDWRPPDVEATYIRFPVFPVISRPWNGFSVAQKLGPYVRAWDPDVILSYVVYPQGFAAVRIAKKLGIPSVLTAIGSDLNRISGYLTGLMTKYALQNATYSTTVSHDLGRTAIRLGAPAKRVRTIINGCDTSVFFPQDLSNARRSQSIQADNKVILYVGRLDVRKGLVELIEATAQLRVIHSSLELIVIGDGPDRKQLLDLIEHRNASAYIRILKTRSSDGVSSAMAASNVVALPSYNEGCPNVVLEALAAGRPVVASAVGGIPELVDDTCGRLVPARNVSALACALGETLDAQWDANLIAARHKRSWSNVAEELTCVLQTAAGKDDQHSATEYSVDD